MISLKEVSKMYKIPTRHEVLKARGTKSLEERLVIAIEHLCDIFDDRDSKRINDSW